MVLILTKGQIHMPLLSPSKAWPRLAARLLVLSFVAAISLGACSGTTNPQTTSDTEADSAKKTRVAASFYPIAEATTRVGGDCVEVTNLTPAGGGPHDLELTPKQVTELSKDNLVFYLSKGFQPQVEAAVENLPTSVTAIDLLAGLPLMTIQQQLEGTQGDQDGEVLEGDLDPHVWVNPLLQIKIAQGIHDALVAANPSCASTFDNGLASYKSELETLDADIAAGLANCSSKVIVTTHRAFVYFSDRYGLVQIPIAGISPDVEPDPKTLEAVASAARSNNVQVIYFEDAVPPDLAQTVAREIGATTDALSPVETIDEEGLAKGEDYNSVMRANLAALKKGLACS
jgi:zinc transport system substrate-binding protein